MTAACVECGNDDPCEGYTLCSDCLEGADMDESARNAYGDEDDDERARLDALDEDAASKRDDGRREVTVSWVNDAGEPVARTLHLDAREEEYLAAFLSDEHWPTDDDDMA